ncbi:MAG: hypothetical protein M3N18_05215 [Actinomycetota bacterium]|nr:hypothetical protein [Actinomycetota bacterium]
MHSTGSFSVLDLIRPARHRRDIPGEAWGEEESPESLVRRGRALAGTEGG